MIRFSKATTFYIKAVLESHGKLKFCEIDHAVTPNDKARTM